MTNQNLLRAAALGGFLVLPLSAAAETVIDPEDFPWGLEAGSMDDVSIASGELVFSAPTMLVKRDGDDKMSISAPSASVGVSGEPAPLSGKDIVLHFERDANRFATIGSIETLNALVDDQEGKMTMTIEAMTFALNASGFEDMIEAMEADVEFEQAVADGAFTDLDGTVTYAIESMAMTFDERDAGGMPPRSTEFTAGVSEASLSFEDGRLEASVTNRDNTYAMTGPIPFEGSMGVIGYGFSFPFKPSADPQNLNFDVIIEDVSVSDELWAIADPKGVFPREFQKFTMDVGLDVILEKSFLEKKESGDNPFNPVSMTLKSFDLSGFGLEVSSNGSVDFEKQSPGSNADPKPILSSLRSFLSVKGLSGFMASVVEAGMVPEPQAIMVEGMAGQFGKPGDDGELIFDIRTNESMLTINDAPVIPLPQQP